MNTDLRFTDTNSADDSKGRTWGLDGNLFWYLIGGGFSSVFIMLLLFSAYHMSFVASAAVAVVPLILTLIYVFAFRQNKPPSYDVDCLEVWLCGNGFSPELQTKIQHPLHRHV
jgi:Flp pilus assembly protein TadB